MLFFVHVPSFLAHLLPSTDANLHFDSSQCQYGQLYSHCHPPGRLAKDGRCRYDRVQERVSVATICWTEFETSKDVGCPYIPLLPLTLYIHTRFLFSSAISILDRNSIDPVLLKSIHCRLSFFDDIHSSSCCAAAFVRCHPRCCS